MKINSTATIAMLVVAFLILLGVHIFTPKGESLRDHVATMEERIGALETKVEEYEGFEERIGINEANIGVIDNFLNSLIQ